MAPLRGYNVARAAGWHGEIRVEPDAKLLEDERPDFNWAQDLSVDSRRIRSELGYQEITDPDDALRLSIEWERMQQCREAAAVDSGGTSDD